jgi:Asp-tRNA(Asn)/Glu-tRNA(Gln) amidotransferase A subunit family amidase
VIGYKGSHEAFSLSGVRPLAQSFDSLGILSRSIENIQAIRQTLIGRPLISQSLVHQAGRQKQAEASSLRLGFCRTGHWPEMEPAAQAEVERVIARLRDCGIDVVEVSTPDSYKSVLEDHGLIMAYEVARNYAFELGQHAEALSEQFRVLCKRGLSISHDDYCGARNRLNQEKARFAAAMSGVDAWIAPSALGQAPLATEGTGSPVMCLFWTALGAPCVALPSGFGHNGRPLGIQLVQALGEDQKLLAVAGWVSRHLGWHGEVAER